ncbi:MAG: ribonuclease P protein component [Actinomycetales bacterium]
MLPAAHRLRRSADIVRVTKSGVRVRRGSVVVHLAARGGAPQATAPRFGYAVGRSVGNSVIRHLVTRRLRSISRLLVPELRAGSDVVIRALPEAANATFSQLQRDVQLAVQKAQGPAASR